MARNTWKELFSRRFRHASHWQCRHSRSCASVRCTSSQFLKRPPAVPREKRRESQPGPFSQVPGVFPAWAKHCTSPAPAALPCSPNPLLSPLILQPHIAIHKTYCIHRNIFCTLWGTRNLNVDTTGTFICHVFNSFSRCFQHFSCRIQFRTTIPGPLTITSGWY